MPEENPADDRTVALVNVWSHLGARVRQLRQAQGLTQLELATRLSDLGVHLHQSTVAKLEAGTRPTVAHELWALAKVLGATYDMLLPEPRDPEAFQFEEAMADYEQTLHEVRRLQREASRYREMLDARERELQRWRRDLFETEKMYPGIGAASKGRRPHGEHPEEV